jgi:hypothetical protein
MFRVTDKAAMCLPWRPDSSLMEPVDVGLAAFAMTFEIEHLEWKRREVLRVV